MFACVSFSKGLAGEASCGCFGTVKVNPWYTFALDAAAVAALLRWRPSFSQGSEPSGERPAAVRLAAFASVWLAVGLPIGWLAGRFEPTIVTDEGEILGESQIVVLEPERWIGTRFPLLPHVDIGSRLAEGRWIVLLYHHDCPECRVKPCHGSYFPKTWCQSFIVYSACSGSEPATNCWDCFLGEPYDVNHIEQVCFDCEEE